MTSPDPVDTRASLVPPRPTTRDGRRRRVGVEIELAGLTVAEVAEALREHYDGQIERHNDYEIDVHTRPLGPLRVERDAALLKRWAREREEKPEEPLQRRLPRGAVEVVARRVVPCEVITRPLDFEALAELDDLALVLRRAGARGTEDSIFYALGIHFNPEAPDLGAPSILAHLRAFTVLYPWLLHELAVDPSRRVVPFIDPYPLDYTLTLTRDDYDPDLAHLIDDYLAANPTRDRALDMLCLFAHVDPDRVFAVVDDPRIQPRPTYHYRLSNSSIPSPIWKPTNLWRYWLMVEELAASPETLAEMAHRYHAHHDRALPGLRSDWDELVPRWLDALRDRPAHR